MKKANVTHLNSKKSTQHEQSPVSYERLFHQIADGVVIVNFAGKVEYLNPAYERMFGVSNFAVIGKSIYQIPNDDLILNALKMKKSLQGYLKLPFHSSKISVSVGPLMEDQQFGGILAVYREEAGGEKTGLFHEEAANLACRRSGMPSSFQPIIGNSDALLESLRTACQAARSTSTVLITGESGTGKEVVAKAIHEAGKQAGAPFITVNCGAIPANLLETELFGHEMGAFTGAVKKKIGKFEQAHGGTIFLDEIGDMPLEMQVKILRVLQEKSFERVGGNETIHCSLRIIAATHRNLEELVEADQFREDLYYRLNVVPVNLPALRERLEDILPLSQYFLKKIQNRTGMPQKQISKEAGEALVSYHWPGNIRELENLMERLMVLVEGETILLGDLPEKISYYYEARMPQVQEFSLVNRNKAGQLATLEQYEKEIIRQALNQFGSFNQAAKALGITHKTVAFKARKYDIIQANE